MAFRAGLEPALDTPSGAASSLLGYLKSAERARFELARRLSQLPFQGSAISRTRRPLQVACGSRDSRFSTRAFQVPMVPSAGISRSWRAYLWIVSSTPCRTTCRSRLPVDPVWEPAGTRWTMREIEPAPRDALQCYGPCKRSEWDSNPRGHTGPYFLSGEAPSAS